MTREEPKQATIRPREPGCGDAREAARKRAAVEIVARHGQVLRQTARRYSLCEDDAEDAYQRMLEILLTKAPTDRGRELIAWAQTVIRHEALSIRRNRERLLGGPPSDTAGGGQRLDLVALIPALGDAPDERAERREAIARSREALQALKPAELRALTLLAQGYSYAEIGELTGFSHTKVNRCLAEGRERFRRLLSRSEDGSRCEEMRPLLSAFCDGEASAAQEAALREHLRACAGCRSTLRAYRATPGAVAALAPVLPLWRSLLERTQAILSQLHSHLSGQVATACLSAAGGAAVCVATGVVPSPLDLSSGQAKAPAIERLSPVLRKEPASRPHGRRQAASKGAAAPARRRTARKRSWPRATPPAPEPAEPAQYTAPPPPEAPESPPPSAEPPSPSGSAAGEFGP